MFLNTLSNLLLICLIVCLVHESGFINYWDDWINERYKFRHLPYPIRCALCTTFWCSILYIIITGNFTILMIAMCLLNAHLTKIVIPVYRLIENLALKLIELLNRLFKL